ncbi:hypothetical protein HY523_02410 [Candidatus Berkelbacteria bacterium]|nr:hypothetical protein [Candidatus Berkelbacteria bacterium]
MDHASLREPSNVLTSEDLGINGQSFTVLTVRDAVQSAIANFSGVQFEPLAIYVSASLRLKPDTWWQAVVIHEAHRGHFRKGQKGRCLFGLREELNLVPVEEHAVYLTMRQETLAAEQAYYTTHPVRSVPDLVTEITATLDMVNTILAGDRSFLAQPSVPA